MSWYGYEEYYATQEYHETTQEDHDTTQEHHDTTQEHYDTTQEHYDTTQEHNSSSYDHDSSTQTPLMESDSMLGVSSLIVVLGLLGVAIFWWRRCKTWYKEKRISNKLAAADGSSDAQWSGRSRGPSVNMNIAQSPEDMLKDGSSQPIWEMSTSSDGTFLQQSSTDQLATKMEEFAEQILEAVKASIGQSGTQLVEGLKDEMKSKYLSPDNGKMEPIHHRKRVGVEFLQLEVSCAIHKLLSVAGSAHIDGAYEFTCFKAANGAALRQLMNMENMASAQKEKIKEQFAKDTLTSRTSTRKLF